MDSHFYGNDREIDSRFRGNDILADGDDRKGKFFKISIAIGKEMG